MIKIFIKSDFQKTLVFECIEEDTIKIIKKRIYKKISIKPKNQLLFYKGNIINENENIKSIGLENNDCFILFRYHLI